MISLNHKAFKCFSDQTVFMAASFFLLSLGYLIILLQYAAPMPGLFDNLGDLIRTGSLLLLLVAFRQ
jgi:hypothetical protein